MNIINFNEYLGLLLQGGDNLVCMLLIAWYEVNQFAQSVSLRCSYFIGCIVYFKLVNPVLNYNTDVEETYDIKKKCSNVIIG